MVPLTVVVPAGILANITLAGIVATVILAKISAFSVYVGVPVGVILARGITIIISAKIFTFVIHIRVPVWVILGRIVASFVILAGRLRRHAIVWIMMPHIIVPWIVVLQISCRVITRVIFRIGAGLCISAYYVNYHLIA